jgi:ABC-type glycerol-3-phosphate transport system substrate-binding protein
MRKIDFIAVICFAVLLAACGGDEQGFEIRPTPIVAPAAEGGGGSEVGGGAGQPITLRLWTHRNDAFNAAYQAQIDAYMAVNPDVTIRLETFDAAAYEQTIQDALASGTAADVLQLPGASVCGLNASLAPATETVAAVAAAFAPPALAGFTCDGVLFGLPQESATPWGLAINKAGIATGVAWDFVRFAVADPANAALWNQTTGTLSALQAPAQ